MRQGDGSAGKVSAGQTRGPELGSAAPTFLKRQTGCICIPSTGEPEKGRSLGPCWPVILTGLISSSFSEKPYHTHLIKKRNSSYQRETPLIQKWWHLLLIPTLWRQRWEDLCKSMASLEACLQESQGYRETFSHKTKTKQNEKTKIERNLKKKKKDTCCLSPTHARTGAHNK